MRAFTILLVAMVLASVPYRAYANSVTDQGAGFLSYKHKKATKDFFVVRSGQGDQCSVVHGEFSDIPAGHHHYLMRYATEATPRLLWFNFAHLFSMSLLPLSTAWMAVSELAPQPVAFYAAVFFLVNATYVLLIWELIDRTPGPIRSSGRVHDRVWLATLGDGLHASRCLFFFFFIFFIIFS